MSIPSLSSTTIYKIVSNLVTLESITCNRTHSSMKSSITHSSTDTNLSNRKSGQSQKDKHKDNISSIMTRDNVMETANTNHTLTVDRSPQFETRSPPPLPSAPSAPPLKILFLSSDTGGGHRASAESLASQFQTHYPNSTYQFLDICKDLASPPFSSLESWYTHLSSHPSQWNMLYQVSNSPTVESILAFHFQITLERKVRRKIQSLNPDVVISVHPLMNLVPTLSCHRISCETGKHLPMFTVVTDLGSGHCTWFEKGVEKMFIASEQIRQLAKTRGKVPEDKIIMSGLPIRQDFAIQAENMGSGGRTSFQGRLYQEKIRHLLGLTLETTTTSRSNINTNNNTHDIQDDFLQESNTWTTTSSSQSQLEDTVLTTTTTTTTEPPIEHPIILVMGGGEGVGSLSSIVNALYLELYTQQRSATILVVCGRNETLRKSLLFRDWGALVRKGGHHNNLSTFQQLNPLRVFQTNTKNLKGAAYEQNRQKLEYKFEEEKKCDENDTFSTKLMNDSGTRSKDPVPVITICPLGFITNMAEYMVAADLLISKAGPGTIAEAAAVGLPVLLTSFLPGQEEGNVDVVIQNKFGGFVADTNPFAVAHEACGWLKNKHLMDEMSSHAMSAGVPSAAEDIVKCIGKSVCRWKELNEEMN